MEDSVDVKTLRARFNQTTSSSDASGQDSGSPKCPRPGFGQRTLLVAENNLSHSRPSPVLPPPSPPPLPEPGPVRPPRPEPMASSSSPSTPPSFHRPLLGTGTQASVHPADSSKVKQKGEMLQNLMLRHQRPTGPKPLLSPEGPALAPTSSPLPLRHQPRQRSAGEVTPLRRPLPPEGPLPLKPKRPPSVHLEPFRRFSRGVTRPAARRTENSSGPPCSAPRAGISPVQLPPRANKPGKLVAQTGALDAEDQDTYDDIASFEREPPSETIVEQTEDGADEDVYEFIDGDQVEVKKVSPQKMTKKEAQRQQERERKEWMEHQKRESEMRKNFQLQGQVEVLHTARVRHNWQGGGKLELSVRQGESVEILRVRDTPGGKWLARSLDGNYGYISNTCVDIDYEEVKRKALQSKKLYDVSTLPPPPPDPPHVVNMESNSKESLIQGEDDYDDVQLAEDFPPPPPEISLDPKAEKELRKRFKFEGPVQVLHIMMVDPNCILKKPKAKHLHVSQGEVLEIIQLTSSKKALCRNGFGKYGYVPRSLLLPMEGDIYDDVDYPEDVYDNDSLNTDY